MNKINHFISALAVTLVFARNDPIGLLLAVLFSLVFGVLIDLDHVFNKKAPWYMKRTWIQEPTGLIFLGLPLGLILRTFDPTFFWLVMAPYATHIVLDYLCIFPAKPFAPFFDYTKREGLGVFIPDTLLRRSENSSLWHKRVKEKGIRGVSENYFTPIAISMLLLVILLKFF